MRAGEIPSEIQPESAEPDLERNLQNIEVGAGARMAQCMGDPAR